MVGLLTRRAPFAAATSPQTYTRKKVTDKFAFPRSLDMAAHLPPAAADGGGASTQYELVAILAHKGSAATSGHYGASVCVCLS